MMAGDQLIVITLFEYAGKLVEVGSTLTVLAGTWTQGFKCVTEGREILIDKSFNLANLRRI